MYVYIYIYTHTYTYTYISCHFWVSLRLEGQSTLLTADLRWGPIYAEGRSMLLRAYLCSYQLQRAFSSYWGPIYAAVTVPQMGIQKGGSEKSCMAVSSWPLETAAPGKLRTGKCADTTPSKKALQASSLHPRPHRGQHAAFPDNADFPADLVIWSSGHLGIFSVGGAKQHSLYFQGSSL